MVRQLRNKIQNYPTLITLLTWGVLFTWIFWRSIGFDNGSLVAAHENIWSDWSLHIALTHIFAFKSPEYWFSYHPMYSQGTLTYPFLINFISGMLMRLGLSLHWAMFVPNVFCISFILIGTIKLTELVFKSKWLGFVSLSIFFFSSGTGFIDYLADLINHPSFPTLLVNQDYSILPEYEWLTGNTIIGMLLPQRAFLLGMSMSIWGLFFFLKPFISEGSSKTNWILSACLLGILPIAHMHSLIALCIITGTFSLFFLRQNKSIILYFFMPLGILSSVFFFSFVFSGLETGKFLTFFPGWTLKGGILGFIVGWIKIWGLAIPCAIAGYQYLETKFQKVLSVSFLVVFLAANLILFQPTHWDNSKLFLWVYFWVSALCSYLLIHLFRKKTSFKIASGLISLFLCLTGALTFCRLLQFEKHTYTMTTVSDIEFMEQIRKNTDPLAVFATAPKHNHPITVWAARPILLGYIGWVMNYGFDVEKSYSFLKELYAGQIEDERLYPFSVHYIYLGPDEREEFQVNEELLSKKYPIAFKNGSIRIYRTHTPIPVMAPSK